MIHAYSAFFLISFVAFVVAQVVPGFAQVSSVILASAFFLAGIILFAAKRILEAIARFNPPSA